MASNGRFLLEQAMTVPDFSMHFTRQYAVSFLRFSFFSFYHVLKMPLSNVQNQSLTVLMSELPQLHKLGLICSSTARPWEESWIV